MGLSFDFDYQRFISPSHCVSFDADFENGCLDRVVRLGLDWYHIELRPDTWYRFYFRVKGCKSRELLFEFTCRNTNNPVYDEGKGRWLRGELVVKPKVSYDGESWEEVQYIEKHRQDPGKYRFKHTFKEDEAFISYHVPYTYSDMLKWLDTLAYNSFVEIEEIGKTRNGAVQPALTITDPHVAVPENLVVLIAREDADETLGSWGIEGVVRGILAGESVELLKNHIFKIVPMVGIDGVIVGAHHSAGYGYGGHRWHEEPAPDEIQNVKNAVRKWVGEGYVLKLAGKLHSDQCMRETLGPDGILTADPELRKVFREGIARYYNGSWDKSRKDIAIRPKGYFERFLLDEFGFSSTFSTHVQGVDPEAARRCGEALLEGACRWLRLRTS